MELKKDRNSTHYTTISPLIHLLTSSFCDATGKKQREDVTTKFSGGFKQEIQ